MFKEPIFYPRNMYMSTFFFFFFNLALIPVASKAFTSESGVRFTSLNCGFGWTSIFSVKRLPSDLHNPMVTLGDIEALQLDRCC